MPYLTIRSAFLLTNLAAAVALAACSHSDAVTSNTFTQGVQAYLAQRGDLCLAKTHWPIAVSEDDIQAHTRDAVQMPVFQKLGLVSVSDGIGERHYDNKVEKVQIKLYQLTDEGKKYYVERKLTGHDAEGKPLSAQSDFCVAKVTLDKVVAFDPITQQGGQEQSVVSYTYKVDAAPWTQDADARRVLPVVARLIAGAGSATLRETMVHTDAGWKAKELL